MKIMAKSRFVQGSPDKLRKILRASPGNLADIQNKLKFSRSFKARLLAKTLKSALAAAKERGLDEASLRLAEFRIDQGPGYKRLRIKSRGRADTIKKKTSHITVILEGEKSSEKASKSRSQGVNKVSSKAVKNS